MLPGATELPPEAVKDWHSEEDIKDPPYLRTMRAIQAYRAREAQLRVVVAFALGSVLGFALGGWLRLLGGIAVLGLVGFALVRAYQTYRAAVVAREVNEEAERKMGMEIKEAAQ